MGETGQSKTRGGWGFLCARHKELVNTIVDTVEGTPSNQRGSLLVANLHVYFPRTRLGKMNGLGHVPNSFSKKQQFSSSYASS